MYSMDRGTERLIEREGIGTKKKITKRQLENKGINADFLKFF